MDHPLLMDDFDDDSSTKSISEEDLFETVKKEGKLSHRKISEFSSGDEQDLEIQNPQSSSSPSDITHNNNNSGKSSPIQIKGSPARAKGTKGSPAASSIESTASSQGGNGNLGRLSIFRVLTRRTSNQSKHKKLQDNWIQAREPVLDGVTFCVKFLGSTLIDKTTAADAAEATRTVIQMVKAGQKTSRVGLKVSTRGITFLEPNTGDTRFDISIYDIAHCSTDSSFPNVFSFIATNKNDVNECYCFATRKRKMAQQITLTIAQSFNLAYEIWQNSSLEKDATDQYGSDGSSGYSTSCSSASSSTTNYPGPRNPDHDLLNFGVPKRSQEDQWVHFDEIEEISAALSNPHLIEPLQPTTPLFELRELF